MVFYSTNIIAYLIDYEQAHPEFKDYINSVMTRFGMEEGTQYVDVVDAILNYEYFDLLKKKCGLVLTVDQVKQLLKLAGVVYDDMQSIEIQDNGGDIQIPVIADNGSNMENYGRLAVDLQRMRAVAEELLHLADQLGQVSGEVEDVAGKLNVSMQHAASLPLRTSLLANSASIQRLSNQAKVMGDTLTTIAAKYESTESFILGLFLVKG